MDLKTFVWKEGRTYIIKEAVTGVTTQGRTIKEAVKNIKEAVSLYLEEMPETKKELKNVRSIGVVDVKLA